MATQITDSKVRQAASAVLVAALERAALHGVKAIEAAALMSALRDWSEAVRRGDVIQRLDRDIELSEKLSARSDEILELLRRREVRFSEIPAEFLEDMKARVRVVVVDAMKEYETHRPRSRRNTK